LLGLQGWLDCVTLESLLKSLLSLTDWF
jgi:hypothetical protein